MIIEKQAQLARTGLRILKSAHGGHSCKNLSPPGLEIGDVVALQQGMRNTVAWRRHLSLRVGHSPWDAGFEAFELREHQSMIISQ